MLFNLLQVSVKRCVTGIIFVCEDRPQAENFIHSVEVTALAVHTVSGG
jgi:hypothetical protein